MAMTIGLDIGSSAVRAVQVNIGRGPATLDRLGQVMLPPGAVRDGEIADRDAVVDALRLLWSRYKLKGRKVALGLANQQVVVRQIDLPYLPEKELRQSLQFQVQDYIPIAVDQALLDFHVLEHYESENGQRFSRILLVAAQREMVSGFVEVVRRAKLEPVGIDLAPFAILRSLAPQSVLEGRAGELLVDVGASVTNIVVHQDGVPHFVRILLMGGNGITDALVNGLGLPFEEAEAAKQRVLSGAPVVGQDQEAARLVAERAHRFVEEIRGSVDYYSAQSDSVPVRKVVLSGGASKLPGLADRLAQILRIDVVQGHPMQDLHIGGVGLGTDQLVDAEPYLAVAIGLALGAAS